MRQADQASAVIRANAALASILRPFHEAEALVEPPGRVSVHDCEREDCSASLPRHVLTPVQEPRADASATRRWKNGRALDVGLCQAASRWAARPTLSVLHIYSTVLYTISMRNHRRKSS